MNYLDKLKDLKDSFKGEEIVVFACGPSLNDYSKEEMINFCKGKKVACIKQSFFRFKEICDFHFINDNNMLKYSNENSFLITSGGMKSYPFKNLLGKEPDLHLKVTTDGNLKNTIASTNNFSLNQIEDKNEVLWGPGIMLESVIPFITLCGFKKVYFLGWDYSKAEKRITDHYYNDDLRIRFTNPTVGCYSGENSLLIENSSFLHDYLLSFGIESFVLSRNSHVSSKFKRIDLND